MLSCFQILEAGTSCKRIQFQLNSVQFRVTLDPKREFLSVRMVTGSLEYGCADIYKRGGKEGNRVVSCEAAAWSPYPPGPLVKTQPRSRSGLQRVVSVLWIRPEKRTSTAEAGKCGPLCSPGSRP